MENKKINSTHTSRDNERDMFGTPKNRTKTWSGVFKCVKKDRRDSKNDCNANKR
jgi:hypothetical protein|tara:strand:- start:553 stop:714 length:162 start_codon:yes stop_codon:yes gene_type:complete